MHIEAKPGYFAKINFIPANAVIAKNHGETDEAKAKLTRITRPSTIQPERGLLA